MTFKDWVIVFVVSLAVMIGAGLIRDYRQPEAKAVMCQIEQHGSTHLLPCKLVASYLAEISL